MSNEQAASLERVQECDRAMLADKRRGCRHLDHRQPPARGRKGVTLFGVGFLPNAQGVELRVEGAAVDDGGRCKFIFHDVFLVLSPIIVSLRRRAFENAASAASEILTVVGQARTRLYGCRASSTTCMAGRAGPLQA